MPTVLLETFGTPTGGQLAGLSALQYVPMRFIRWVLNDAPVGGRLDHVRNTNNVSQRILLGLIEDRKRMMKEGGGGRKDIMSHILRAGLTEDPTAKLTDYEIVSDFGALFPPLYRSLTSSPPPSHPHSTLASHPPPPHLPPPLCLHRLETSWRRTSPKPNPPYHANTEYWGFTLHSSFPRVAIPWRKDILLTSVPEAKGQLVVELTSPSRPESRASGGRKSIDSRNGSNGSEGEGQEESSDEYETESEDDDY
ncbi:hypothetical protein NMY22_g20142 [Coprinellus aureogranulatus]|nr:hypothetical protein NMY22_g20142 [Coprinellus aureogranulatus]